MGWMQGALIFTEMTSGSDRAGGKSEGREEGQIAADQKEFKIPLWIQVQKPSGHVKDLTTGRVMTI